MRLVGAAPFAGSKATLDRPPWKGADGGLRILLVLRFLHIMIIVWLQQLVVTLYSLALELEQWLLVPSSLSLPGTLAVAGAPRTIPYFIRLFQHYAVFHPIIPALCQLRERAYYARNYAGIIASSLLTIRIYVADQWVMSMFFIMTVHCEDSTYSTLRFIGIRYSDSLLRTTWVVSGARMLMYWAGSSQTTSLLEVRPKWGGM